MNKNNKYYDSLLNWHDSNVDKNKIKENWENIIVKAGWVRNVFTMENAKECNIKHIPVYFALILV